MNENLNLVETLKDVPAGTKLYSPIFGDVELLRVEERSQHPIKVRNCNGDGESFTKEGRYFSVFPDGECVLFPSKENRDWSTFLTPKPGDFVYRKLNDGNEWISIHKEVENGKVFSFADIHIHDGKCFTTNAYLCCSRDIVQQRRATPEEDDLCMECLKNSGFIWNKDLLSLTKIYENKVKLKPFQEVLVRDSQHDAWQADLFTNMRVDCSEYPYGCFRNTWKYCIPYKGNEDKLGKV